MVVARKGKGLLAILVNKIACKAYQTRVVCCHHCKKKGKGGFIVVAPTPGPSAFDFLDQVCQLHPYWSRGHR